jgi:hypothetical protein
MKKLITILAVVFSTTCFAQTIPASQENEYFRLDYLGYTTYLDIGYVVGIENYTAEEVDVIITWATGTQVVHLPPFYYEVYWIWGPYVQNSKIRARVVSPNGIPGLQVKVTGNYYF